MDSTTCETSGQSSLEAPFSPVPGELRALRQWVGWKLVDGRKLPVRASHRGIMASSTKPETWSTFEEAAEGWRKALEDGENPARGGVGFVFNEDDPYIGIDFDNCLDDNGNLSQWAAPWIERLSGAYMEVSPSGRGIKVWTRGRFSGKRHKRKIGDESHTGIEAYDRARYFCVTDALFGEPPIEPLPNHQSVIDDLCAWIDDRPASAAPGQSRGPDAPHEGGAVASEPERAAPTSGWKTTVRSGGGASAEERAAAYLDTVEPAVSGQGGHNTTLRAAMIGPGFDLSPDATFRLLWERYNPRCVPPWTERELRHKVESAYAREARRGWLLNERAAPRPSPTFSPVGSHAPAPSPNLDANLAALPLTDMGNAQRLAARFGPDIRYCHTWGQWLVWDGRRYAPDESGAIKALAKQTARGMLHEAATVGDDAQRAALVKWQKTSEGAGKIEAMISLAQSEPGIPVDFNALDGDGWLLNCQNGTVDLRTGELRPHDRSDLITQLCPLDFDPNAQCPLWEATLNLFFEGDQALIAYVRRLFGYFLTGIISEHILPIAHGDGANGKSTILGAMQGVLGSDYAMKALPGMLLSSRHDRHPTEVADLFRKRLVLAIESEAGRPLNESLIKELTGGDRIRARKLYQNPWEFASSHKIIMATNHKPRVTGRDNGIWRRLRLIPFLVSLPPEDQDPTIPDRLIAEYPGILAWAVRGCLSWREIGLNEPEAVRLATADYAEAEDVMGAFLTECTMPYANGEEKSSEVFGRYKEYCEENNERAMSMREFRDQMLRRGYSQIKRSCVFYVGLKLKAGWEVTTKSA